MLYEFNFYLTFDLDVIYVVPLVGALNLYFWIGLKDIKGSFLTKQLLQALALTYEY